MSVRSYKRHTPEGPWDAIVIGSGIGGLTAASLLSRRAKQRVLVLERHYTTGGYTHVFKRPGYEWDVGIHYVGDADGGVGAIIDEVTGGLAKWAPLPDCYDRIVFSDQSYDMVRGHEAFIDTLAKQFPGGRESIEGYIDIVRKTAKLAPAHFAARQFQGTVTGPIGSAVSAQFFQYSDRTVEEALRPVVRDPRLFDVLTGQWGDYGLSPRHASFAIHAMTGNHFLGGGFYPVGGPGVLADGAAEVISDAGGELFTNADVEGVLLEGGHAVGVTMADGKTFRAPVVISDAGVPITLNRLLPREVAEKTGLLSGVKRIGPSSAHLCLHLGFKKSDEELGLTGTNLWVYADGDREEAVRRFTADPEADLPLTFISFPSAKDPSWSERYPNKSTVEVITLVPMKWFEQWAGTRWMKRGSDYDDFKERMTQRLLEKLFEQCPQLRGEVDHCELSTPLTTAHFAAHPDGEMYGLTHTPARFRLPLRARTTVPGLYLTGADIATAGVAGAVIGGVLTVGTLIHDRWPSLLRTRFGGRRGFSVAPGRGQPSAPPPRASAR